MDLYRKVRLACAEGMSQREAARHFNISRDSVAKMMAFSVPPGYRRTAPVKRPKLDAFTGIIDGWLDGDREDTSAFGAGAVFVFRRDPVGWAPAVYLKASNTDEMDWFGHSLAVSDDGRTLAIGAILEDGASAGVDGDQSDNSVEAAGAVYVRQIAP